MRSAGYVTSRQIVSDSPDASESSTSGFLKHGATDTSLDVTKPRTLPTVHLFSVSIFFVWPLVVGLALVRALALVLALALVRAPVLVLRRVAVLVVALGRGRPTGSLLCVTPHVVHALAVPQQVDEFGSRRSG